MDELFIRRASVADAQLLSELSAVTFFDTFKGTCTEDDMQGFIRDYFNKEQVERELRDTNDFYFIAFIRTAAVGYIRLKEEQSEVDIIIRHKAIELKRIYVLTEYHSRKIGAALLKFSFKFAAERNYELIWLGVWEHNEKAKTFYKKFGFEDTGVKHPFPIGSTPQFDNWLYRFIRNE